MKIIECEQGSVEWALARAGIPTASEFDNLVTPKWKIRDGQMPMTYLYKKLAEKWTGGPLVSFNTVDMDIGHILEEEARPRFQFDTGLETQMVGFITTDDGRVGCSPDGLVGEQGGVEIKCPEIHTHIKYLVGGEVPDEYAAQVQGSMFVTGRPWWYFFSYRRNMEPLCLKVERDEKAMAAIEEALDEYYEHFDLCWKKLCDHNGGPPVRQMHFTPAAQPEISHEEGEGIH